MEPSQHWLLTSLVLTTGNNKASNAPFNMWTCSLEAQKQKDKKKKTKIKLQLICKKESYNPDTDKN